MNLGLGILQIFIGLGAVAGGVGLISGGLKFPLEWLRRSPFTDYLIPGLVLLTVNGIGSLAGGVASNTALRQSMMKRSPVPLLIPSPILCTDNAAMIAACGYFKLTAGNTSGWDLDVNPGLKLI